MDVPTKPPIITNAKDAMILARDVFIRASTNGTYLTYDDFNNIFQNKQHADNAFTYFDVTKDKIITRSEFRNVILHFYQNRKLLESSIKKSLYFTGIIQQVIFTILFAILLILSLIIYNVAIKELLALFVSSALMLNFVASGVLNDACRNMIMVFSHQFDIGDEVLIDNSLLTVYDMGISITSFKCENGGKIKFLNSDLWKKTIINMSKAPEKLLVFTIKLPATLGSNDLNKVITLIHEYLLERPYDYFENFTLENTGHDSTGIDVLNASIILKCKGNKSRSKKFAMRAEFTAFLRNLFHEFEVSNK